MQDESEVVVLRLGHRPGRDERMTTHVCLTARAFGADRIMLPAQASTAAETVRDITTRFGGPFSAETTSNPQHALRDWTGRVCHLTMYGERIQDVVPDIRSAHESSPILVVVGAAKLPFDVYAAADWNVAVTNQPHSEVAALAIFLDRLFEGQELDRVWEGGEQRILPQPSGKRIEPRD